MNLDDFIKKYNGIPNVGTTPENNGQCTGIAELWILNLGLPVVWGNAKDFLTNADPAYFDVIQNTPDNVPSPGDLVVWGTQVGAYGHIAIFVSGDSNSFTSFDQNWPLNSAPHLQTHSYSGVIGWLHPKTEGGTTMTTDNTKLGYQIQWVQSNEKKLDGSDFDGNGNDIFDYLVALGFTILPQAQANLKNTQDQVEALQGQVNTLTTQTQQLSQQVTDIKGQDENDQKALADAKETITGLNEHIGTLNKQLADAAIAAKPITTVPSVAQTTPPNTKPLPGSATVTHTQLSFWQTVTHFFFAK